MLYIPPTNKDTYISGIVALNIHSPNGTGDWHSAAALSDNAQPMHLYVYGANQPHNTNHLLGNGGVIEGTQRLQAMGYAPANSPVWIADHPRACVDYLYTTVLQSGAIGRVMLDEWFPGTEDKQAVYAMLDSMQGKLTQQELHNLALWKAKNPLNS